MTNKESKKMPEETPAQEIAIPEPTGRMKNLDNEFENARLAANSKLDLIINRLNNHGKEDDVIHGDMNDGLLLLVCDLATEIYKMEFTWLDKRREELEIVKKFQPLIAN